MAANEPTDTDIDKDKPFSSVTGSVETHEPALNSDDLDPSTASSTPTPTTTTTTTKSTSALPEDPPPSAPAPTSTAFASTSRIPAIASHSHSRSHSNLSSPKVSRESSPIRPQLKTTTSAKLRSRNNSVDHSPSRTSSVSGIASTQPSVPSAAAVQRALSTQSNPSLLPTVVAEPSTKPIKSAQLPSHDASSANSPHWPTSPRMKTTQPASVPARISTLANRKPEPAPGTPNIVVQRPGPSASATNLNNKPASESVTPELDMDDQTSPLTMRTPARGVSGPSTKLETVEEGDPPTSEADTSDPPDKTIDDERPEKTTESTIDENISKDISSATGSGNESGGSKKDGKPGEKPNPTKLAAQTAKPSNGPPRSYSTLSIKGKLLGEASSQSMTVETETVSSIPQVAVGGGAGERSGQGRIEGGSLRLKPSTETIRPKKEKKKTVRKAPSLNAGTASSKADIFEAKVASAVDEANSSDSEETFVYESNPPEPRSARPGRHHSRTPSVTSMHSQWEQRGGLRSAPLDGNHSVAGKRSMKFANSSHSNTFEGENAMGGDGAGTGRGSGRHATPNPHHSHIGRWGRSGRGQAHASLFDHESPLPQGSHLQSNANGTLSRSVPTSPRSPHHPRFHDISAKKQAQKTTYDIDMEAADDEGTPLLGSIRINRNRPYRRPGVSSLRQTEYSDGPPRVWTNRFAVCLVFTIMIILFVFGAMGVLFATTEPLTAVRVHEIRNVLASEQEIMLDLLVEAVNPNIISITVGDMDVNVFAKSRHLGTDASEPSISTKETTDQGVDEGNDPIPPPALDSQTMLLGRIFTLDSSLLFTSSPFAHHPSESVGEVRLAHPGNKTEQGGSARWERVLQHPFELIVRGVLKYELPLLGGGGRVRTSPIGASVVVHPEEGVDATGAMRLERVKEGGGNTAIHRVGVHPPQLLPPSTSA
ncbi:MAG: hypothetical protein M1817_000965 [Caeruleum heppii]|nr:MAG: hypothetical protein M1817_000965 [Caeruleum heppii]